MKTKWIKKTLSLLLTLGLVLGALVFSPFRQDAVAEGGDTVTFTVEYKDGWYKLINVWVPYDTWGSLSIMWPEGLLAKQNKPGEPTPDSFGMFPAQSPADSTAKPGAVTPATNWTITVGDNNISLIMTGNNTESASLHTIRDYLAQLRFYKKPGADLPSNKGFRVSIRKERIASFTQDNYEHYYEYFRFFPGTRPASTSPVVTARTFPVDPLNPGTSGDKSKMWMECYNMAQKHVYVTDDGDVLRGYLATISTQKEQDMIYNSIADECGWLAGTRLLYNYNHPSTSPADWRIIENNAPLILGNIHDAASPYYNYDPVVNQRLRLGAGISSNPTDGMGYMNLPIPVKQTQTNGTQQTTQAMQDAGYMAHGGPDGTTFPNKLSALTAAQDYYWYWSDGATAPDAGKIYLTGPLRVGVPATGTTAHKAPYTVGKVPATATETLATLPTGRGYKGWQYYEYFASTASAPEPNDSTCEWVMQFAYNGNPTWNDFSHQGGAINSTTRVAGSVNGYYVKYSRPLPEYDDEMLGDLIAIPQPVEIHYVSRTTGGTVSEFDVVQFNGSIGDAFKTVPASDKVPTGYVFASWDEEASGAEDGGVLTAHWVPAGANGNAHDQVEGTIQGYKQVLYFVYQPISMLVKFHPNHNPAAPGDWTGLADVTPFISKGATYDDPYGALPDATRAGYDLEGWYLNATGGAKLTPASLVKTAADHTLYAHWTPKSGFAVRYDLNYGNIGGETTVGPKSPVTWTSTGLLCATPARPGYRFTGWSVSENGTGTDVNIAASYGSLAANDTVPYITLQAGWIPNDWYAVKYDLGGGMIGFAGSAPDAELMHWDDVVGFPEGGDPTRAGYTFAGWNLVDNGVHVNPNTPVPAGATFGDLAANESVYYVILKAQWTPKAYEVHYDPNSGALAGGTSNPLTGVQWSQNKLIPADEDEPTRAGYSFAGWRLSLVGGEPGDMRPVTAGETYGLIAVTDAPTITLQAQWTEVVRYGVKYDWAGGTVTAPDKSDVEWSDADLLPADDPTREGYIFGGWRQLKKDGSLSADFPTELYKYSWLAESESDTYITLQAQWVPRTGYLVKYDLNGGTGGPLPDRAASWVSAALLPTSAQLAGITAPGGTHLTGWVLSYRGAAPVVGGEEVTPLTEYGALALTATVMSVTLKAVWEDTDTYRVHFDLNNADSPAAIASLVIPGANRGDLLAMPGNPVRAGYVFQGWRVIANAKDSGVSARYVEGDDTFDSLADSAKAFIILQAVWKPRTGYTVVYNLNAGGDPTLPAFYAPLLDVSWTQASLTPGQPTRRGYSFTGWFTHAEFGEQVMLTNSYSLLAGGDPDKGTVVLYARWKPEAPYVVHYDLNGADSPAIPSLPLPGDEGVFWNDAGLVPDEIPTKQGHGFLGWKVTVNRRPSLPLSHFVTAGDTYGGLVSSPEAGYITLQAQWRENNSYVVQYDMNAEGDTTAPADYPNKGNPTNEPGVDYVYWGSSALLPSGIPTRAGYTFGGWFTDYAGGAQVISTTPYSLIAGDDSVPFVTLYARWNPKSYTVNYDSAGGSAVSPITVGWKDSTLTPLTDPTRTGHHFSGWKVIDPDTGVSVAFGSTYASLALADTKTAITLQAQWDENDGYYVRYDMNGATSAPVGDKENVKWNTTGLTPSTNPTRDGYHFDGWTVSHNGLVPDSPVTASDAYKDVAASETTPYITLQAQWTAVIDYAVEYELNGGLIDDSSIYPAKTDLLWSSKNLLPNDPPTRTGYLLTGWNVTDGGSITGVTNAATYGSLAANDSVKVITLQAQWALKGSYLVLYDLNNATSAPISPKTDVAWTDDGLLPPPPARTGYTFGGWAVTENGKTAGMAAHAADEFCDLALNDTVPYITLQAQWGEKGGYTVHYDTDGGSPAAIGDLENLQWTDDDLLPKTAVTKTGHTLAGWDVTDGGSKTGVSAGDSYGNLADGDDTAEITLTARWAENGGYHVHYDVNHATSGDIPDKVGVQWSDDTLLPPTPPTRTGYDLVRWDVTENGPAMQDVQDIHKFYQLADGDSVVYITLQAQWEEKGGYTVKYDTNGGTPAMIDDLEDVMWTDNDLLPPTPPTRIGYTLAGWDVTDGGGKTGVSAGDRYGDLADDDTVDEITLTARWDENGGYHVHYDVNGATSGDIPDKMGVKWSDDGLLPATLPTRTGYTLDGWVVTENGKAAGMAAYAADKFYDLALDDTVPYITLQAQWSVKDGYAVTYVMGGGEPAEAARTGVRWTDSGLLPDPDPVRAGWVFAGWKITAGGKAGRTLAYAVDRYADLAADEDTDEITLTAQWVVSSGYLVLYDTNGATSGAISPKTNVKWTDAGLLPAQPSRPGYTFAGWTVSHNGADPGSAVTASQAYKDVAANDTTPYITLQAQWTEKSSYTVKYEMDGGEPAEADRTGVRWTEAGLLPAPPTKDGWVFAGWRVTDGGGKPFVYAADRYADLADDEDTLEIELTAQWVVSDGYLVLYDLNGATSAPVPPKTDVKWTDKNLLPAAPTKTGYTFDGWDVTANGTDTDVQNTDEFGDLASNVGVPYIVLQAQWREKGGYTVKYDTDGGTPASIDDMEDVMWTDKDLLPDPPTKTGWSFTGWDVTEGGSKAGVSAADRYADLADDEWTDEITLTARWLEKTGYIVIYDLNGASGGVSPKTGVHWTQDDLLPAKPSRPGYDFVRWDVTANGSGTGVHDGDPFSDLADDDTVAYITLQAQWREKNAYEVRYNMNGATSTACLPLKNVRWTQDRLLPSPDPVRTGYTFVGWTVTRNGNGMGGYVRASDAFGDLADSDAVDYIELSAQWVSNGGGGNTNTNTNTNGGGTTAIPTVLPLVIPMVVPELGAILDDIAGMIPARAEPVTRPAEQANPPAGNPGSTQAPAAQTSPAVVPPPKTGDSMTLAYCLLFLLCVSGCALVCIPLLGKKEREASLG